MTDLQAFDASPLQAFLSSGLQARGPSGNLYSWGVNFNGQLGLGDNADRDVPTLVAGHTFAQVIAGNTVASTFGLTSSSALYSWGRNTDGQLGLGDNTNRNTPTLVVGHTFAQIAVTLQSTFGLIPE